MSTSSTQLDGDTAEFLRGLAAADAPAITAGTVEQARAAVAEFLRQVGIDAVPVAEVEDLAVPGGGGPIPVRRYRAFDRADAVLVFLHGGGWTLGDLEGHDPLCRRLAADAGVEVVSVDYRLAPEHPFPAGLEDTLAVLRWVAGGLAAGRPLILAGDSSGGNLAAVAALRARDAREPTVALQVLLYPVLDHDLQTESYRRWGSGHLLLTDDMRWFFDRYVPAVAERDDPAVSPLRIDDPGGVAPALIAVGDHDPLLDEATAYAERLRAAGVEADLRIAAGHIHGYLTMPKAVPSAAVLIDETIAAVADRVERLHDLTAATS